MARRRRLSDEEHSLWQQVAASVTPLPRRAAFLPPEAAARRDPPGTAAEKAAATPPAGPPIRTEVNSPAPLPKKMPVSGLDKRTAQRLRKGKMPLDGRLDLHGMTQTQAHGALLRFIAASRSLNRRLVLVITGKGWDPMASRPEDAVGVLRRSVPRWLETPPLNQHVAAITNAHAKDGGSGALYVLLRRKRPLKQEAEE